MIIVIGGDKGGTGKSHLATNLTVCLSQQGKRTGLVETDLNGSTKKWNKRREQAGLPPVALNEAYGDISAKITKMADVAEILIIDTAGYDSTEFRTALKVADIVIVPIDPLAQVEADSLQTVTKIVRDAQKINPRLAAHVLLYKCQPNTFSEQQELRDSLNSHDYWLKAMKSTVSFLRAFVRAMNQGMGVHELKSNVSGASQAKAQIELLLKELEL
ncbi:P-loop NTPase [Salmonella enterica subsp. enterica serovar Weltevreden]|uniref:division plane positioning ATPase MipZ n=1 Tax=Enterobacteriaceae TaxID=543 RepID=UPI001B01F1C9|nr:MULTISPECIES: division plane positioning ATPase MipZ [Enterobacteriaceae]MDX5198807.1 P-loop NTPase [Salmonella enterica subsp. enterica serovar Weltevreden]MDX5309459.1 P-loop NTPase [Salmonella enterica subsp. enterica serovar Weltevreden]HAZ7556805.1 P-loop NTPase [Escherichia coli]HAZ7556991.1 P-loop NTPase [Escherichia coli]